jgi:predicted Zn-dependent protease
MNPLVLPRRESVAFTLALTLVLLMACATNPVTRQSQLMLISQQQEIQIGEESSKEIQKEYGYYDTLPGLNAYVNQVGEKLVSQCERKDLVYHFQVLDTPVINAFALPGGYVYVTRGILARMNSEDELAAVLGHELTHVAARHGAAEMSKAMAAQAGLAAVSIFNPNVGQAVGQFAGLALNLAFLGYSRGLEAQADEHGITYAIKAGYNPRGATKMFQMFKSIEENEPSRMDRFLMSHPPTGERLAYASDRVGDAQRNNPALLKQPLKRDVFIRHIDGLLLGQSRGEKVVLGDTFYQKAYRISLSVPENYGANLAPSDPDAQAVFTREIKTGSSSATARVVALEVHDLHRPGGLDDFVKSYLSALKVSHRDLGGKQIKTDQGEALATRLLDVNTKAGTARVLLTFAVRDKRGYVVYGYTDPSSFDAARPEFNRIIKSFRFLSESDIAGIHPPKLRVVTAKPGETWDSLAERELGKARLGDKLAVYNGIFKPEREPERGMLVKIPDVQSLKGK